MVDMFSTVRIWALDARLVSVLSGRIVGGCSEPSVYLLRKILIRQSSSAARAFLRCLFCLMLGPCLTMLHFPLALVVFDGVECSEVDSPIGVDGRLSTAKRTLLSNLLQLSRQSPVGANTVVVVNQCNE